MQRIIDIQSGQAARPEARMAGPVSFSVCRGEQVAVLGDNAAGKTRFIDLLTGAVQLAEGRIVYDFSPSQLPLTSDNVHYLAFRDSYGGSDATYYHQQRWHQQDMADDAETAGMLLDRAFAAAERRCPMTAVRTALLTRLCGLLSLHPLLNRHVLSLSSGELRKLHLARALLTMPRVLILDSPFIGLDAPTRQELAALLNALTAEFDLLLVLVLSRSDVLPSCITHVVPVSGLRVLPKMTVAEWRRQSVPEPAPLGEEERELLRSLSVRPLEETPFYPRGAHPEMIRCTGVSVNYGGHTILPPLDWVVREGERWVLEGDNGSGKSTLLSLVCADNPQAYACDIALFGHRRGSGESIWDIKRHIGYVSPELHRAFMEDVSCLDVVASGHFDTMGLFQHAGAELLEVSRLWMRIFGIGHLASRRYLKVSSGEQRLCLLARAFVKDPELLVLDEPFHGLDDANSHRARQIIDLFVTRPRKTLVMVSHFPSELPACMDHRLRLAGRSAVSSGLQSAKVGPDWV